MSMGYVFVIMSAVQMILIILLNFKWLYICMYILDLKCLVKYVPLLICTDFIITINVICVVLVYFIRQKYRNPKNVYWLY